MKLLHRSERDAPAPAPAPELASGQCPRHHSGFEPCAICADSGIVRFPTGWSHEDDVVLQKLVSEGRPATFIALSTNPPRSILSVLVRIRELGLEDIHEPSSFVNLRPFMPEFRGGVE